MNNHAPLYRIVVILKQFLNKQQTMFGGYLSKII